MEGASEIQSWIKSYSVSPPASAQGCSPSDSGGVGQDHSQALEAGNLPEVCVRSPVK